MSVRLELDRLLPSYALFVDRNCELLRNGIDVIDVEMDERVRSCVSFMLGEIELDAPARNRDEPRQARFELMLPLLLESEPLVPANA